MRIKFSCFTVLAVCLVALLVSGSALADNNPLITLDENGNGTLVFPGGSPIPTNGVLSPDPGPGGLASVLTYNLLGPPSLVAGDVKLTDADCGGCVLDVIRFNPAGTGSPGYPASVLFYSDNVDGLDALGDTPSPPGAFYTNVVTIPEIDLGGGIEGAIYTPTANQPGFVQGFSVTYRAISDTPEPGSIMLLGSGLFGLAGAIRRKLVR